MARRADAKTSINTPVQKGRKATQRERLLNGMIAAANRDGYAGANVSAVIEQAGVSRPTFYDYFADRDDCFIATVRDVQARLMEQIAEGVRASTPELALAAAIEATVQFASSQPAAARFLMKEALAAGPDVLDVRDAGLTETAQLIEAAFAALPAKAAAPDIPVAAILGTIHRLLATRLRRGERVLEGLQSDLLGWVASYATPVRQRRWDTLKPTAAPERSPFLPRTTLRAPQPLGPGRPRIPEEEVAENHRQRILFATSQVVAERGFTAATIAEITRVAGVDGREFYRLYSDKQEAFSAIHEVGFQYLMAVTAGAFFAAPTWPERIWEAFRAATQAVEDNPTVANVGFVEAYAVGARGIQRVEDSRVAFTIFLQEGYRYEPAGVPPTRLALEAIVTAIFEISYLETRRHEEPQTAGLLAHIVHLCLTPFMGAQATNKFIDSKLPAGTGRPRAKSDKTPGKSTAARTARGHSSRK
jgi:AcrR family transcriptional regulator